MAKKARQKRKRVSKRALARRVAVLEERQARQDTETAKAEKVDPGYCPAITTDEKQVVCVVFEWTSDLWLVENFDPEMR